MDNTKAPTTLAPTTLAPTKTSKKHLKKSSLKGLKAIKRKATKPTKITEEDIYVQLGRTTLKYRPDRRNLRLPHQI